MTSGILKPSSFPFSLPLNAFFKYAYHSESGKVWVKKSLGISVLKWVCIFPSFNEGRKELEPFFNGWYHSCTLTMCINVYKTGAFNYNVNFRLFMKCIRTCVSACLYNSLNQIVANIFKSF